MTERMQGAQNRKIFYNKLVRDDIEERIHIKGEACEIRVIEDDAELQQELLKKVREEASSLAHSRDPQEFLAEYCDLMVVLDALTAQLGFSEADIKVAMEENIKLKGFYKKRHFLHWSDDGAYKSNETPQGLK